MWVWVAVLYVVSVVVQFALALRSVSPWIMKDEIVYSDLSRSFAASGHFLIRGVHGDYGVVYPLLLSPVYAIVGPMADVYRWTQLVNALAMSSVVLPAYLLARRVVRPPAALAACALTIAVPSMAYVGTLMTENLFYPLFVWLALTLVLALERPTVARQVLLLALCALAFLTRAQAVALIAAVLSAPFVLAWIERARPRRLAVWKPLYGAVVLGGLLVVVIEVVRGRSPVGVLGNYKKFANWSHPHVWSALKWILFHVAELDLSLYVLPFAALLVLAANARRLDRPLRVFVAAAASLSVWLVVEVSLFASRYSGRIEERNMFYVAPLFLIALFAWIERGRPLPPRTAIAVAGIAAALPGTIPYSRLLNITSQSDTVGFQPWWYLNTRGAGYSSVALVAVLMSIGLAAGFLWLPRRYASVLPLVVAVGFVATWLPLQLSTHSFPRLSASASARGIGGSRTWIDDAVGHNADVDVIWSGGDPLRVWQNEFWNRTVKRVYGLGASLPGDMPEIPLSEEHSTGRLLSMGQPITARYALTDRSVELAGTVIASDRAKNLLLYRVAPPLRATSQISGWYADGWTTSHVEWTRSDCAGGALKLHVHSYPPLFNGITQHIVISGAARPRVVALPSTQARTVVLPLTARGGTCRVDLNISPARIPADYPSLHLPDSRLLGVELDFARYVSPR